MHDDRCGPWAVVLSVAGRHGRAQVVRGIRVAGAGRASLRDCPDGLPKRVCRLAKFSPSLRDCLDGWPALASVGMRLVNHLRCDSLAYSEDEGCLSRSHTTISFPRCFAQSHFPTLALFNASDWFLPSSPTFTLARYCSLLSPCHGNSHSLPHAHHSMHFPHPVEWSRRCCDINVLTLSR